VFRKITFLIFVLLCSISFAGQLEILLPGISNFNTPLSYGTVTAYEAGTNELKTIYGDAELTIPHDNPAQLDSSGRLVSYGEGAYKLVFKASNGDIIFSVDNYNVYDLPPVLTRAYPLLGNLNFSGIVGSETQEIGSVYYDANGNDVARVQVMLTGIATYSDIPVAPYTLNLYTELYRRTTASSTQSWDFIGTGTISITNFTSTSTNLATINLVSESTGITRGNFYKYTYYIGRSGTWALATPSINIENLGVKFIERAR